MNNLTAVEKYALFILKNGENIGSPGRKMYVRVGVICQMLIDGNITVGEKNIVTVTDRVPETECAKLIYEDAKARNGKVKLENMIRGEQLDIKLGSIKRYFGHAEIVDAIKTSLQEKQAVTACIKDTLFGDKCELTLVEDRFSGLLKEVRATILDKQELKDEDILLISLLKFSRYIKDAFCKYEKDALKNRLEQISESDVYKTVQLAQQIINSDASTEALLLFN